MCDDCSESTSTSETSSDTSSDTSCDMSSETTSELPEDMGDLSSDGAEELPDDSGDDLDCENVEDDDCSEEVVEEDPDSAESANDTEEDIADDNETDNKDDTDESADDIQDTSANDTLENDLSEFEIEKSSNDDLYNDGSEDLPDAVLDSSVFDDQGNLRVMNNEEYLSLSQEQQDLFEQKYNTLSQEEKDAYDKQFAQADLENYNRHVKSGEYNKNANTERDLQDIIGGQCQGNDDYGNTVCELGAKGAMSAIGTSMGLDPLAKADLTRQAGDIGRIYGPNAMENITRTAYVQNGIYTPTPIVGEDEYGNKTYDYGVFNVGQQSELSSDMQSGCSDWDSRITDNIDNSRQLDIYKNANLRQAEINDRPCLVKDIDYDYVDEKTGMTNRELMAKGRSPIDAKTSEKIELHHMGQNYDSPFAELTENSEHGDGNHKILHPKNIESWRNDDALKREYQKEKINHWITRSKEV